MLHKETIRQKLSAVPTVARYGSEMETPLHSMLGLPALVETMAEMGVPARALLAGTGISPDALGDSQARISVPQKIKLFSNVQRLSPDPAIGMLAGRRQRISDLGVFGYAILSSATFGEAIDFGIRHVRLAGPVIEKSFRVEGDVAIFEGHDTIDLGDLLPIASEFWFGSMQTLISHILGRTFQARRLMLPYAAPAHANRYAEFFGYPVEFDAPVMQWHFDATMLDLPLPAANPIMAEVSAGFCARMLEDIRGENELVKEIREACLNSVGGIPRLEDMASRLNQSTRTLQRRLMDAGCRYQDIIDDVRRRLAIEYLERTTMSVEQVAERSGFSDVSNFRKAFKKWTGRTTAYYRARRH
ncbi:MAG: AraC family transcriptional regulator [Variovorax sp.]